RDPRSVSASLKNTPWGQQHVAVHIKRWKNSIEIFLRFKDWKNVLGLRYEDLVNNPEFQVKNICEFIGEEFIPQMVNHRQKGFISTENRGWTNEYLKSVTKPITDKSINKWKNILTNVEISAIQLKTKKEMNIF